MTHGQRRLLAAVTLTQGFAIGLTFGIFPVFLQPLEQAFGASRTVVSSGQILLMLAMSVGGIVVGSALDKGYPRKIMLTGALLMCLAFVLACVANQLWLLAIAAFLLGLTLPSVGPLVSAGIVTRYFAADRGRALGIMSIGPPLGSGLFAALAGFLIPYFGWQMAYLTFACLCIAVLLPVVWFAIPVQFPAQENTEGTAASNADGMFSVVKQPVFFWTVVAYATAMGISTAWTVHVAAFLGSLGLSLVQQSGVLAFSFWMGIPGALVFGMLADRLPAKNLFVLMIVCMGVILLAFATGPSVPWLVTLSAILGFVTGGAIPLYTMLLGQRVATESFGKAMGVSNLFVLPAMALAVLGAAGLFERQGHYSTALMLLAVGLVWALISAVISNRLAENR